MSHEALSPEQFGPHRKAQDAQAVADRLNQAKDYDRTWYHVSKSHGFWVKRAGPGFEEPSPSYKVNPEVAAYVTRNKK